MKIKHKKALPFGGLILVITLLTSLTGCVGWVDSDGDYGSSFWVDPGFYLFGGGYYGRGHDYHGYSQRGAGSRAVAHSSGGGHAGGGGGHGGGGRR